MISIIFNMNAVLELSLGFIVLLLFASTIRPRFDTSTGPLIGLLCSEAVVVGFDLYLRLINRDTEWPLLHPDAGGHLLFLPVWLLFTICFVVATLMHSGLFRGDGKNSAVNGGPPISIIGWAVEEHCASLVARHALIVGTSMKSNHSRN